MLTVLQACLISKALHIIHCKAAIRLISQNHLLFQKYILWNTCCWRCRTGTLLCVALHDPNLTTGTPLLPDENAIMQMFSCNVCIQNLLHAPVVIAHRFARYHHIPLDHIRAVENFCLFVCFKTFLGHIRAVAKILFVCLFQNFSGPHPHCGKMVKLHSFFSELPGGALIAGA